MNPEKRNVQLHGLDHLRALAITLVFFCHYQLDIFGHPSWMSHASFGWTGVDLFFVLSGFLISSQLFAAIKAGSGINYRTFFLKRSFRILPAYWAVVAIYFLVPQFREEPTLPPLARLLTFTHNFGLDVTHYAAFAHAWSLCVEEHFYFALPITLIILHRLRILALGPWLIVSLFIAGYAIRERCWGNLYHSAPGEVSSVTTWFRDIYYPTYNRLDGLLTGVSIAAVYVFAPMLWQRVARYGNVFLVVGLVLLAVAYRYCYGPSYNLSTFGFPLISIGYGCLVAGAVSPSSVLYKFKSRATALIATLSYGIYLLHKGAIHITQSAAANLGLNTNGVVVMLLCTAGCVLFALVLHHAIELPFMKLRDKVIRRAPGKRAAAPQAEPDDNTELAAE